jgi:hypothetical protein
MAYSRGRHLSKRQKRRSLKMKNVKSRKVMRGGGIFNGPGNCSARVANAQSNYEKRTEIEVFTNFGKYAKDVKNKNKPCESPEFYANFTSKTGV